MKAAQSQIPAGPVDPEPKDDGDNDGYVFNATDPHCPVDAFIKALGDMMDWGTIKGKPCWICPPWTHGNSWGRWTRKRFAAKSGTRCTGSLMAATPSLISSTIYRRSGCWIEWYAEEDGILGCWDILVSMDHFAVLDAESQKRLQGAVNARVAELREGCADVA